MSHRMRLAVLSGLGAGWAATAFLPTAWAAVIGAVVPAAVCALLAESPRKAAVSAVTSGCAVVLLTLILGYRVSPQYLSLAASLVIGAPVVAMAMAKALRHSPARVSALMSSGTLVLIIIALWGAGLTQGRANPLYPFDSAAVARDVRAWGLNDYHLYVETHARMNAGEPYYSALVDASAALRPTPLQAKHSGAFGFRQPLLYWLWGLAASIGGMGIPLLYLAFGTAAVWAAYVLAGTFVRRAPALVGAAYVAAYYAGIAGSRRIMFHEFWAAALLLVALAFGARALARREQGGLLTAFAVIFALLAALVREHALLALLAGTVAWWWRPTSRPLRERLLWPLAIAAFGGLFAVHVAATGRSLMGDAGGGYEYFAISRLLNVILNGTRPDTMGSVLWGLLLLAGVVGSLLTTARARIFVAGTVAGLAFVTSAVGPAAALPGAYITPYWVALIESLALACVPLVLLRMPGAQRPSVPNAGVSA